MLLSEALDQTQARNSKILATFGEGIQEQLGAVNDRVSNVENETVELKTEVKQMRALVAEVQTEQKRQADPRIRRLNSRQEFLSYKAVKLSWRSRVRSPPKTVTVSNLKQAAGNLQCPVEVEQKRLRNNIELQWKVMLKNKLIFKSKTVH